MPDKYGYPHPQQWIEVLNLYSCIDLASGLAQWYVLGEKGVDLVDEWIEGAYMLDS